jgi:hypothetical protein
LLLHPKTGGITVRATEVIRQSLDFSERILKSYLEDLSDADIKVIPIPGMNPIALQLGHLISTERMFLEEVRPGASPALPQGFDEKHNLKEGNPADSSRYLTKDAYWSLYTAQRQATKSVLDKMSDGDLDAPGPEKFKNFLPTVGAVMRIPGEHVMMHVGQFVAVRRQVGKPVVI